MTPVLEALPQGARVAVVRLRSLGDCVLTTPALEVLKRARPDLSVAVVVESRFAPVFEGNPDVTTLLPAEPGALRRWRPSLCLDLHGGTRSAWLTAASGARFRAGFGHFRYAWLYNVRIPTAQQILGADRKVHTAEHLASAMFFLGAPKGEIPRSRLFAQPKPAARPYAVLHPKASAPGKTWPSSRFLEVARHLDHACHLEPVFIAGPREDLSFAGLYRGLIGAPLEEIKSMLAGASLFVGNDSGPAHMAAAFQVPLVVLFGDSDCAVWGPWKAPSQVLACRRSIYDISVAEVIAALERLRVTA